MFFPFQFLKVFSRKTVYVYKRLILILTTMWPGPPQIKLLPSNLHVQKQYLLQNKNLQSKYLSEYLLLKMLQEALYLAAPTRA